VTEPDPITQLVQRQYELYPYPDLDPNDMPRGTTITSDLYFLTQFLWGGRKKRNELRVLDAGCGTGAPSVQAAMSAPGAKVIGIDLSETSLDRSRKRSARLGVANVEYLQLPIQRVGELGITFDYIISSGVLHHLPDPVEGLSALRDVLAPDGVMSIMLYGAHGRVGIYMLQRAMRLLGDADKPIEWHVDLARRLFRSTPPWFPTYPPAYGFELKPGNDGGIVDLLLHVQDRPYTVDGIFDFAEAAGMRFHSWLMPWEYEAERYVRDPQLLEMLPKMPARDRYAIAELMHGALNKHSFFLVRPEFEPPDVSIEDGHWRGLRAMLTNFLMWWDPIRKPAEGKTVVPCAVSEVGQLALELNNWQSAMMLAVSQRKGTLGDIAELSEVKRHMLSGPRQQREIAVEGFLRELLRFRGVSLLEEGRDYDD